MKHSDNSADLITLEGVWKLFGPEADKFMADKFATTQAGPSAEEMAQAGLIGAVRDVSMSVKKGEILVIMGLSGSGKSTLVRCMSRLVDITRGRICVEGQDLAGLDDAGLLALRREKMGMVFQNFALLPHRTVLENVAFPLEMRGQSRAARRERALEMIKLVGLNGREEYFPRELSGGQQQRVGIARSLAIEPDIWFLDEPFSALDPLIRREMQDEFLRLQNMLGKTIVFITHDFDEALRLADRIAIMKDGCVEQIGNPASIVLHPQTDYVSKFTEEIEKARVVKAENLLQDVKKAQKGAKDNPVPGSATLHDLARQLVEDTRPILPVADASGKIIGGLDRQAALDVIFGESSSEGAKS